MEKRIAILYSDSVFTPWKENIDALTVVNIFENIPDTYKTSIVHMVEPTDSFAQFLNQFNFVVNVCYGFMAYSQSDVAVWLDQNGIKHLSSSGSVQALVENKLATEDRLASFGLPIAKSFKNLEEITDSDVNHFISKPIKGGCHRGITTYTKDELIRRFESIDLTSYLVQPYIFGREFSVAVIPGILANDYVALKPIEIKPYPSRSVFIAGQQYGTTVKDFTPDLTKNQLQSIKAFALNVHNSLDLKYYSRIDFRMNEDEFYILDVNSMPNLHPHYSLLPAILEEVNISFKDFIQRVITVFEYEHLHVKCANECV